MHQNSRRLHGYLSSDVTYRLQPICHIAVSTHDPGSMTMDPGSWVMCPEHVSRSGPDPVMCNTPNSVLLNDYFGVLGVTRFGPDPGSDLTAQYWE